MNLSRTLILLALALVPLASPVQAQQQITSKVPVAFDRFYEYDELLAIGKKLCDAYPELLSMEEIGKSVQGRPMFAFTLNNAKTGTDLSKPAMYIDGNIHGNEIQAAETVLYSMWYLVSAYGSIAPMTDVVDRTAFYFVLSANPDGRAYWFSQPNTSNSSRGGQKPVDDDRDGVADEDGPDDLNSDGEIGVMWRPDPNGSHKRSELDPNRMEPVTPEVTKDGRIRRGSWSFAGSEGIDNDGDGQVNEDGPGGYDPNRNWPTDWQPDHVQSGAGEFPLSLPESQAVAGFVLAHPNIMAGQAYHNAGGMILRGPGSQERENTYPQRDRTTYDAIAKAGEEMLPFYRSMIIWSDLYTVHGGFVNWLAESLGAISFTNELWNEKLILQSGNAPSDDESRRWRERVLFDQTVTPLTEVNHPTLGKVLVGGSTKYSSRIPPPFMLQEQCHRNFAFTFFHASQLPLLRFASIATTSLGSNLWQVDVEVANDKLIPTRTERAASKGIGLPDRLTLSGDTKVVTAGTLRDRYDRGMSEQRFRPATVLLDDGIGGRSSRFVRFIVEGKPGAQLKLNYAADKASAIETSVTLDSAPPLAVQPGR
ncbi:MAG: M14 family metallopeptidase [Phycisphaerae bacterium]|nr:M14 family metallopeptidase [Phycisphaerae bacterium]